MNMIDSVVLSAESFEKIGMRPGDHVLGDKLTDFSGGFGTGIDGGFYASDVAADECRYICPADLDRLDNLNVGGFAHRIGCFDEADPTLGFDQA
jgi:hypothetical protein